MLSGTRAASAIHSISIILIFLGSIMIIPMIISISLGESDYLAFLISSLISIICGLIVFFISRNAETPAIRENILVVVLNWFMVCLFGALPYIFAGTFPGFVDAIFESVSGFTTTGASVLSAIESTSHGIIFWRSLTHWIGGIGIIFIVLLIMPQMNVHVVSLYQMEASEVGIKKLTPRLKSTLQILITVYLAITGAETFLLLLGGMDWFEAITHSFATVATGGFSTRNISIESFQSLYIDIVITIFMFISGINYALFFHMIKGKVLPVLKNEELRFYTIMIIISILLITLNIYGSVYTDFGKALRYACFQVVSISSTTGFSTADYNKWPYFSRILLLVLMLIGACPGSTTGAIKNTRIILLGKQFINEFRHIIHPHQVMQIQLNDEKVSSDFIRKILIFICAYLFTVIIATVLMTASGVDLVSSTSAVITTMGGVGPGLAIVGPASNYATLPSFSKYILIFCILAGRLELFIFFILFYPKFWKE